MSSNRVQGVSARTWDGIEAHLRPLLVDVDKLDIQSEQSADPYLKWDKADKFLGASQPERALPFLHHLRTTLAAKIRTRNIKTTAQVVDWIMGGLDTYGCCLLYTSDAADE